MATEVKYYTDEHVAISVATGMRARGVHVLTCQEANMLKASDEEHLMFAREQKMVIITQDRDFLKLDSVGFDHAGIVYAPQGTTVGDIIRGLMLIFQVLDAEDMVNHVEYL
jgi:uncharacterized protein with PIN domain